MYKYLKYSLFVLFSFVIISCDKEPPAQLELSAYEILIPNVGAQEKIMVQSNGKWTATVSATWCTISPMSGDGNSEITITASDNIGSQERRVTLYVTSRNLQKNAIITQDIPSLNIDQSEFILSKGAETKSLLITSNTRWQINIPAEATWLMASPMSGEGNKEVLFTISSNEGPAREVYVSVDFANTHKSLRVSQERGLNSPPGVPNLKSPPNSSTDVTRLPAFRWGSVKDPDGDEVSYRIAYSSNQTDWTYSSWLNDSLYYLKETLTATQIYYWKVEVKDNLGASSVSDINAFTTGTKTSYFDGEYRVAQSAVNGVVPSEILFIGDGYMAEDFVEGGQFDKDMDEGIEYFFDVEPYKTYREYFTVYKQAAYSRDRGVSQTDRSISRNTKFKSDFLGGSSLSTQTEEVFYYARKIDGVDDEKLKNLLIILILNENRYAGTCWMWSDGKAIAIVPMSRSTSSGAHYRNILHHEAGGHGFGRLADEYITSANSGKMISEEDKKRFENFERYGFYPNVSLTGDVTTVKWHYFINRLGYNRVNTYQGAFYWSLGAWRSEISSCMIQNEPYFNAPSREAIVRRILETAGEEYTLNKFLEKDTERAPNQSAVMQTKSINPLTFVPLAPPVIVY